MPGHSAEEEIDLKDALMDEPIVGVEQVQHDEHKAFEAKPVRSPTPMTAAQKEKHDLTHLPPDQACPICASSRTPNLRHATSHEHLRTIPLLVGDYCFLRRADDSCLATCLVMKLYPYKLLLATLAKNKGLDPLVIKLISKLIRDMGLQHVAFRCDRDAPPSYLH